MLLAFVTLLLAGGDLLEIASFAQPIVHTTAFQYFHGVHDILALGFVLVVAYYGSVNLGAALLGVFFLVHIPYFVLTFPEDGPEHVSLIFEILVGIGFLGMTSKLHVALGEQQNIADTLQEALLTLPESMKGIDFAHFYSSATETTRVGGDFYDLFERENHLVGITIGDVSGKGLEAATLTALIKNTIRAYAYEHEDPALVLAKTNKAVAGHMPRSSTFVTVIFGFLDTRSGTMVYANAGHPPPIIKKKGAETRELAGGSLPVGMFFDAEYDNQRATVREGDTIVFYTDGVIEARNDKGMLGEAGLIKLIRDSKKQKVAGLTREIFREVNEFSGGHLSDDLALLVVTLKK